MSKSSKPYVLVKKAYFLTSLYVEPVQSANIEYNVNTSAKESIRSKLVNRVEPSGSSVSEKVNSNMSEAENFSIDKSIYRLVANVLKEARSGDVSDVITSLAKAEHSAETTPKTLLDVSGEEENPSRRKEKSTIIVNVDELDSNEEPIAKNLPPGIAKRMKNRRGKVLMNEGTPSKTSKKKVVVGPTKRWRKVVVPTRKRNELSSSEFDYDVEHDVQDITPLKKAVVRKIHLNVPEVPLGLMKNVTSFGECYEVSVKELMVNIPADCDKNKSKEFRKVFVRGKCVEFSPNVINRYMGRCEDEQPETKVTDNQVCKEITAKQVIQWPRKGKLSARKLSVKYAVLHRIGATNWVPTNHTLTIATRLGKFVYVVGTKTNFDFGYYVFEQTLKHVGTCAVKMPISFPSLICGIILSQHPGILNSADVASKRESTPSLN
ncbi:uncharacterized protein LOC127095188 [Lathyrus oleraceus]|uniref:uncharacterized protein LOC127095188 n=1 Tax=Pisum sativum TaxID=3888 RepID=UPI0021D2143A|nr:uncharacterized protein LOC127095188 [Pisum sativum]